ncbi:MAG: hypothetical protein H0T52_16700, partial [Lautropia sp.]|nr:hypothetical protein [Lautropia sp.]
MDQVAGLLDHYREAHPQTAAADRRAGRVARLQDRQKRALDTLEHVLVHPPTLADPPSAWLEPATARRIEAVGLKTFEQLVDWIRIRGHRWYSRIPKVGAVAAARVIDWIERNKDALGVALGDRERLSRRDLVSAWRGSRRSEARIVPLEHLAVPLELDGSCGTNRLAGVSRLGAENDRQAIEAWIAARAGENPNTARAHRREAERLLLWSIFERRRPMSSLTVEDAIAYREFLQNPQPAERWIKARRETPMRLSPDWRPFNGPLSKRSAHYALTVLGALFDWLVRQHYLAHNLFGALPRRASGTAAAEADPDRLPDERGRFLTTAQWAVLRSVLPAAAGGDEADLRARFAVVLAYTTGL